MYRITHISDTHGEFPIVPDSSLVIVHSGDMAPNKTRGISTEEAAYQEEWWKANLVDFQCKIGNRIFAYIPGNHDYYDPEQLLRNNGVNAHNLTGKAIKLLDKVYYGFPYIPFIAGEWNYETREAEMRKLVEAIPLCNILVAHCPPFGICADVVEGKSGGNSVLMNWLAYNGYSYLPDYLLCGHFHESRGIGQFYDCERGGTLVSNAATVQHTFEIE